MVYSVINKETGELTNACRILLHVEIVSDVIPSDIRELLYCSRPYASKKLREMWICGLLTRKLERIKRLRRYRYKLSKEGERKCQELHKKGY